LAENLEKIELPTQLVAVLADPLLQKFMRLRPSSEGLSRVGNWLMACMDDVTRGDADSSLVLELLDVIHEYTMSSKVSATLTCPRLIEDDRSRPYHH